MPYTVSGVSPDDWAMTEPSEPRAEGNAAVGEQRAVKASPDDDRRSGLNSIVAWVGIASGVVFIVAVIFFSGFFIGRSSSGTVRGGYHQPGMMWPSSTGPYGRPDPGMNGPGGMMGPSGPWPDRPTTPAPNTSRP